MLRRLCDARSVDKVCSCVCCLLAECLPVGSYARRLLILRWLLSGGYTLCVALKKC